MPCRSFRLAVVWVWACQDEDDVHVGGKTNRATITFEQEMDAVLDEVPEVQSS